MNDYIKMLQQANIKIAELEKDKDELNIQIEVLKHSDAEYYGLYSELLFSPNEPPESLEAHNLDQQSKGIEFAIDAGIDFQQIENDVAVCNAIRTRAKAKALKDIL
jgi:hypothetical protein